MEIEGIVVKPAGFQTGRKYPLVVRPHGGPHGAVRLRFSADYQVYASHGYVVFAPNFRGSSGYGQPFLDADRGNLGGKDYLDLMSGVDHLISQGYVDPDRLTITGTSYGGFMTAWTVGHTDRFKAAMAGAPVVNAQSFFGTSDIPTWVTWEYYGPPWKVPGSGSSLLAYFIRAVCEDPDAGDARGGGRSRASLPGTRVLPFFACPRRSNGDGDLPG